MELIKYRGVFEGLMKAVHVNCVPQFLAWHISTQPMVAIILIIIEGFKVEGWSNVLVFLKLTWYCVE